MSDCNVQFNFNGLNIFGKFVRDMSSLSLGGLIMVPGQEANHDNLGKLVHNCDMLDVLIRIASMRQFL